jgi:anti-sigma regulatory factor (Ser/Thr protein kinase)
MTTRQARRPSSLSGEPAALLTLRAEAAPKIVPEFRHAARDFARRHGADIRTAEDIELAVSEAVTNAVRYAYEAEEEGSVDLIGTVADGWLEIRVVDRGHGFREGRSGGLGLGLSIISQMAPDLIISQGERGATLRMRFLLLS